APRSHLLAGGIPVAAKRRILIAEDNEDAGVTLQGLMESLGYEAHLTNNGEVAVRAALTLRPDVVILDIGMPIFNGYDTARMIRRAMPGRQPLIIALTGWGAPRDIAESAVARI